MRRLLSTLRIVHRQVLHNGTLCRTLRQPVATSVPPTFSISTPRVHHFCTASSSNGPPGKDEGDSTESVSMTTASVSTSTSDVPPTTSSTSGQDADVNLHSDPVSSDDGIEPQEPERPPPTQFELDGGMTLGRLAKLASFMKHTLEHDEVGQTQLPMLAVELEQQAEEAFRIIQGALDKVGKPCSVEELGDRSVKNVVLIPIDALHYKDYLRATTLRDQFERACFMMQVFPPKESHLERQGRPNCRLERKRLRERELAGLPPEGTLTEEEDELNKLQLHRQDDEQGQGGGQYEIPELRPVSKHELARRKKHLEESATISHVLAGFDTALLQVGRVHKVVKGGTNQSMRALVIIGNRNGTAGYGEGKSETPQHAIERACRDAKRNLLYVDLYKNRTIHHRIRGEFVQTKVSLWPKPEGSGITGNNNYAAIFQLFGIKDIGAKQHGPRNLFNSVKALFNALSKLETPESICASRGLTELPRPPPLKRKPNYRPL